AVAEVVVEGGRTAERRELPMHRRRPDPVQLAAAVLAARRGERRAAQLLGIQPVRHPLRRIPPHRQRPFERFRLERIPEPRHVLHRYSRKSIFCLYRTPRLIWSRSMDSNRAWKLPSPKPSLPLRWMIS